MADEHRRVEPRGVVGSGMLTDPERIEQLEHERDRLERTWREAPKKKFGEVLTEAPPRGDDDDEEREAREDPRKKKRGAREPTQAASEEPSAVPAPVDVPDEAPPLPKVPPDPRARKLHAMLPPPSHRKTQK